MVAANSTFPSVTCAGTSFPSGPFTRTAAPADGRVASTRSSRSRLIPLNTTNGTPGPFVFIPEATASVALVRMPANWFDTSVSSFHANS